MPRKAAPRPSCTIPDCGRLVSVRVRGLCAAHDKRWQKYGTATPAHLGPIAATGGRPAPLTPEMVEDLQFMADHGENSHGATQRINQHTAARRTLTRAQLLDLLRKTNQNDLAAQLVANDPVSDAALEDSETAARVLALKDARAEKRRRKAAA